jgi:DNA invertase Pin-like site-specific DNA recombinase
MSLPTKAIALARISDDKADGAGVARQEADCRALAERLGWVITEVVIENSVSAFKRRRVRLPDGTTAMRTVRPGFRSVLDKLASGKCDGLIAYDLDRLARDPKDMEDLLDIVNPAPGKFIPVATVTGALNLTNADGVAMARIAVAIANKASQDTARRVARKHEELAAQGKPGGGGFRAYGYSRKGHVTVPEEAAIVREIAARILGDWDGWSDEERAKINPDLGESLNSISADLEARNVPTVTGAPWNSRSVKSVVTKPATAGLRTHRGEIVGEAVWEPILDRRVWERVCARLADRHRTTDLSLQRWLNGLLVCSNCESELMGWYGNRGVQRYWCATPRGGCGKIAVNAANAEEEVERQVLEVLTSPRRLEQLRRTADSEPTNEMRSTLAADEEQLLEIEGAYARREITFPEYMRLRAPIADRIKESKALVVSRAPRVLRRLLEGDVRTGWERLAPADKREVTRALVRGWRVLPHDRSWGNKFNSERLKVISD